MIWTAIVLAAGKGTRMKSKRPKVLHEVCGKPMAAHVLDAAIKARASRTVVVIGYGAKEVRAALGPSHAYMEQSEQKGTGHAVLAAEGAIAPVYPEEGILVLNGDVPLLRPETLAQLMERHEQSGAAMTFLTAQQSDSEGLGRVVRDASRKATGIVEWAQATVDQRSQTEINVGAYCFDAAWLYKALGGIKPSKSGEIYLTDMVEKTAAAGLKVETLELKDASEALGVDNRVRLAQADSIMRQRIRERWMMDGVTLVSPESILIDADVEIGQDTIIHPNSMIKGKTKVGEDCVIGPSSVIEDSMIGDRCRVLASFLEGATVEDHVDIGPFSHLRPGAYLERDVHIGNYVEVKNSRLGRDTKSGHFSYIGDATIGKNVNIGAGTITVNFDGVNKLPTRIGDDVFIGSDTMLVAPISVGARSKTGAGAVVIRDVPPDTVVVGVPAKPLLKKTPESSP